MDVVTDESNDAHGTLEGLVLGGTSDEGWVGDLNKTGLGIAYVEVRVGYASGTIPDELNVIDVARHSRRMTGGPALPDIGPTPATTEAPRPSAQ